MGLPGLTGFPQPGRFNRSGKLYGMLVLRPRASPPTVGVNGVPLEACVIEPNCQPFSRSPAVLDCSFTGISHTPLMLTTCLTSKSASPLRMCESKSGNEEMELVNAVWNESDPVSSALDHV